MTLVRSGLTNTVTLTGAVVFPEVMYKPPILRFTESSLIITASRSSS